MKKGFTLVELLAVIVILSIIAVITIPMILNVIEKSKLGALQDSVYGLIESANFYYASNSSNIKNDIVITITNNEQTINDISLTQKLSYKGKIDNAIVGIKTNGKIAVCVDNNEFKANIGYKDTKVSKVDEGICSVLDLVDVVNNPSNSENNSGVATSSQISALQSQIGNLIDLKTNEKTNIVDAINELSDNQVKYNDETDMLDVYYEGKLVGRIDCSFKWDGVVYNSGSYDADLIGGFEGEGYTLNTTNIYTYIKRTENGASVSSYFDIKKPLYIEPGKYQNINVTYSAVGTQDGTYGQANAYIVILNNAKSASLYTANVMQYGFNASNLTSASTSGTVKIPLSNIADDELKNGIVFRGVANATNISSAKLYITKIWLD